MRLLLYADGTIETSTARLGDPPGSPARLILADVAIRSDDLFRHHKTTHRTLYEHAFKLAREAGYDEVLFVNEHGEVAEGSRSNVFVERDGRLTTPPCTAGALDGVFRRHLLSTSAAEVNRVSLEDLQQADALYVSNAVWGLRRAVLATADRLAVHTADVPLGTW